MDELAEIIDATGEVRRCGSLTLPDGFATSLNVYEDEKPVWDDVQIRRVITSPDRVRARQTFGDYWIVNQGHWGSCNGWAAAVSLAKARWLRGIRDKLRLSGSYLYSRINGGRDRGSVLEDGMNELIRGGCATYDLVGVDQIYPYQQDIRATQEAQLYKAHEAYAVQTQQGLKTALAIGWPCIVAVHAGSRYQRLDGNEVSGVDDGPGNHAIHCDDLLWERGDFLYESVNSWGLRFGRSGRSKLRWESFEQTFGNHKFYAIPSTEEGL